MKFHQNVVEHELIEQCVKELLLDGNQYGWRTSQACWDKEVKRGILGNTSTLRIEGDLYQQLITQLKPYLPNSSEFALQLCVWGPLSGISLHSDGYHKWGATLYLNKEWHPDYGGIFIWQDKDSSEFHAKVPEYSSLIVNDRAENHLVTPVSPVSTEDRLTIQIWGK